MRIRDLHLPVTNAKKILQLLKLDYPTLDAELVLCSVYKQTGIDFTPRKLLADCPAIFAASRTRDELLLLHDTDCKLRERNDRIRSDFVQRQIKAISERIDLLLEEIEVLEDATIQIRFGELDFDLIARLQKDPRVDSRLTPQSRASIQVVFGTLSSLNRWIMPWRSHGERVRVSQSVSTTPSVIPLTARPVVKEQITGNLFSERTRGHAERAEGLAYE